MRHKVTVSVDLADELQRQLTACFDVARQRMHAIVSTTAEYCQEWSRCGGVLIDSGLVRYQIRIYIVQQLQLFAGSSFGERDAGIYTDTDLLMTISHRNAVVRNIFSIRCSFIKQVFPPILSALVASRLWQRYAGRPFLVDCCIVFGRLFLLHAALLVCSPGLSLAQERSRHACGCFVTSAGCNMRSMLNFGLHPLQHINSLMQDLKTCVRLGGAHNSN